MILKPEEIAWVGEWLDRHDIKFQEVYDELKDHLLTAIENLRAEGDMRPIEQLLQEVIKKQFPGWWPFEDIVKQYQQNYRRKIRWAMWGNYRHYLNWETLPLLVLLLALSYYIPHSKPVMAVLMVSLLIVSIVPIVYVGIKGRVIKTDKGKQSLVKNHVANTSNFLLVIFNLLFNLISMISKEWASLAFLNPLRYPPVLFVLILFFSFIYALSCIRLSRQEFKVA